jgi:uncharacterized RDD family membrane protein YckC
MAGKSRKSKKIQEKEEPQAAAFSLRAAAFIVDILLFSIVWGVLTTALNYSTGGNDPFYVFLLLSALVVGVFQTTPGKKLFNLRIVAEDAERISMLRAFLREAFGKLISSLLFGLGFLVAIIDKKKQALHDKLVKTRVVVVSPVGTLRKIAAYFLLFVIVFILLSSLAIAYLLSRFL